MEIRMKFALALALTVAGTGFAAAADAASRPTPRCLAPHQIRDTIPLSDTEILFKLNDGSEWVNTLPAKCSGLKFEGGFAWDVHGDTICANLQTFRVLRRGTPCMLGTFSAYHKPDAPH
jgi:hypothetical protein